MISLQGVSKIYRQGKVSINALENIDLSIHAGELVVLRGASGSGKSTLLNIIGGLLAPTVGQVNILGQDFYSLPDSQQALQRKRHIGFVFQQFYLIPTLTVFENVAFPLKLLADDGLDKNQSNDKVNAILEHLGLSQLKKHKPAELSGGQQQRVALARAMVKAPQYVVADEPTASLDSKNSQMILTMLKKSNRDDGNTVILTSHDPNIKQKISPNRVITLEDGHLC